MYKRMPALKEVPMNDAQIVSALLERDERAINHVIDKYSRLLWSIAAAILTPTGPAEEVEECVADVFIQLWSAPEKFDPRKGSLKTWLCIAARSRATDRYRRLSRESTVSLEDVWLADAMDLTESILSRERGQALSLAMSRLPEPDREILLRRYYFEQKPRKIALAMSLAPKQVENRLYRAKEKLRKLLEETTV